MPGMLWKDDTTHTPGSADSLPVSTFHACRGVATRCARARASGHGDGTTRHVVCATARLRGWAPGLRTPVSLLGSHGMSAHSTDSCLSLAGMLQGQAKLPRSTKYITAAMMITPHMMNLRGRVGYEV